MNIVRLDKRLKSVQVAFLNRMEFEAGGKLCTAVPDFGEAVSQNRVEGKELGDEGVATLRVLLLLDVVPPDLERLVEPELVEGPQLLETGEDPMVAFKGLQRHKL